MCDWIRCGKGTLCFRIDQTCTNGIAAGNIFCVFGTALRYMPIQLWMGEEVRTFSG